MDHCWHEATLSLSNFAKSYNLQLGNRFISDLNFLVYTDEHADEGHQKRKKKTYRCLTANPGKKYPGEAEKWAVGTIIPEDDLKEVTKKLKTNDGMLKFPVVSNIVNGKDYSILGDTFNIKKSEIKFQTAKDIAAKLSKFKGVQE